MLYFSTKLPFVASIRYSRLGKSVSTLLSQIKLPWDFNLDLVTLDREDTRSRAR